ncbi:unnamed protein product, partial [Amoebophrya sp. A25]|eukprot:GSA25T00005659001.1
MANALRSGHSIDFRDVAEQQWSKHMITDCAQFVQLLSVSKSAHKILENVLPVNLCTLLERSNGSDAIELATQLLKYRSHRDVSGQHNPYATAVWTVLRCERNLHSALDLLEKTDPRGHSSQRIKRTVTNNSRATANTNGASSRHGPRDADGVPLDTRACTNLLFSMLWAQEHAFASRTVATGVDSAQRTRLLVESLELLSLLPDIPPADLGRIWSGEFAKLLQVPPPEHDKSSASGLPSYQNGPVAIEVDSVPPQGASSSSASSSSARVFGMPAAASSSASDLECLLGGEQAEFTPDAQGTKLTVAVLRRILLQRKAVETKWAPI